MATTSKELRTKIIKGEVDPNNSQLFLGEAVKAALLFLNNNIKLRSSKVPHFILNTGDEIMYRELMDYKYDVGSVTDENFIYNEIPRCIVNISDVNTLPDQLTQPYMRGYFELEYDSNLYEMTAEIRRMPLKSTLNLKYYLDSFTDCLSISQQLITKLSYIRTYQFDYLGEAVIVSLKFPDAYSIEKPDTLDFNTDNRYKTISIDLELETNIPIIDTKTVIESDAVITVTDNNIGRISTGRFNDDVYKKREYNDRREPIE